MMQLDEAATWAAVPSHTSNACEKESDMKRMKLFAAMLALAVVAVLAGRVTAQNVNTMERSFLTFSNTVEMPGVTLEPGTYVFKLADTLSRNVIQVWDKDEKQMIGHWTFVQAERPQVTEDTVVMFKETREGATPAVQFWYFPGEKIGKEFIYPKDQAERIAARTGIQVRSEEVTAVAEAAPAPEPAPAAVAEAPAPEPAPAPAVVAEAAAPAPEPAPVVEETRIAAAPAAQAEPRPVGTSGQAAPELPQTASPLALSGLLGLLSLAGATGLRLFRS
jgi:hypothetical protein